MNAKEAVEVMTRIAGDYPFLLRGLHGIGKSQIVYQFAESLGMKVVERRASQLQEGDILGMPLVDAVKGETKFLPPDWFKEAMDTGVVLFFDELDRATTQVGQCLFEIADSRKIAGNKVHEDTIIVSAINGGSSDDYIVNSMDPAALSRWAVIDFEPTVEEWLEWADGKVDPDVCGFIRQNPTSLENNTGRFDANRVYPSRRSWTRFSGAMKDLGTDNKEKIYSLAEVFVGEERAASFIDYLRNNKINFYEMLDSDELLEKALESDIAIKMDLIKQLKHSKYTHPEEGEDETLIEDPDMLYRLYQFFEGLDPEMKINAIRFTSTNNRYAVEDHPNTPEQYIGKELHVLTENDELRERITNEDNG